MKENGDFLKELRGEIESTQVRRASYIKAKLAFVVSMIGVGSISIVKAETTALLYLAPFVAYIFDFYVFGEDFGIRRAGAFFRKSTSAPKEEILWERTVKNNRDPFSKIAGIGSSILVLLISATLIYKDEPSTVYCWWLLVNIAVLCIIWLYSWYVDIKVDKFTNELEKQKKEI
jgi:hypothetical protein